MKKTLFVSAIALSAFMISCNSDSSSADEATTTVEETTNVESATTVEAPAPAEVAPAQVVETTTLSVDRMNHDFGDIPDTAPVETKFVVTNTGDKPLLITNAQGSCGCTVPEYPKEPIAPGESKDINVSFNPSGRVGANTKTVTITANTEPATTIINIKSNVIAAQ